MITQCRICGSNVLVPILDLGVQALTGVFPREASADVTRGPLVLVKCHDEEGCGLVQLGHDYDLDEMYGANYGYRSSLNRAMVKHLSAKVAWLQTLRKLEPGELVLDIGSNDGTTLSQYPTSVTRVGIDPTAAKFAAYYPPDVKVAPEFFDAAAFERIAPGRKAAIVTSIAMFYDLPSPLQFVKDVASVLADDGIWHFEQSYLPSMLATNSYDTACHEHIEYYGLRQVAWMTRQAGLRIVDVQLNDVNGGSFAVTVTKGGGEDCAVAVEMLARETELRTLAPYEAFASRVALQRSELRRVLGDLAVNKKRVIGLGASTKGNVVLQYCGIDRELLPAIAEVNADKFGCFTPGTRIPIISEDDARAQNPDVFFVLPWHFRAGFVEREKPFFARGGKLLFPLPTVELVGS